MERKHLYNIPTTVTHLLFMLSGKLYEIVKSINMMSLVRFNYISF